MNGKSEVPGWDEGGAWVERGRCMGGMREVHGWDEGGAWV
jgi:hypothetical protein